MNSKELNLSNLIKSNKLKSKRSEFDGGLLYQALERKTTVYDPESDKIFFFTDNAVIEVDNNVKNEIISIIENFYLNNIKKGDKFESISSKIYGGLIAFEQIQSAYIDTPRFSALKKDLFTYILEEKNKSAKNEKNVKIGIEAFLIKSKENVKKREIKFPKLKYSLVIGPEKAYARNEFISELLEFGIINYDFLVENGVISNLTFVEVDEIYRKQGLLTNKELQHALIISNCFESRKEILDYYIEKDKRFYSEFATTTEIARALVDDRIDSKIVAKRLQNSGVKDLDIDLLEELLSYRKLSKNIDFIRISKDGKSEKYIDEALFKELDRERFMRIVLSDKVIYKNPLNSDDYIDFYGKLNSDDIIKLNENGLVNSEDVIKLVKFSSVKNQNEEEHKKMLDNLIHFYNIDRLEGLLSSDKINKNFSMLFNKFLNEELTQEQRNEYIGNLLKQISNRENGDETLIKLINKGIEIHNVSENYLIDKDIIQNMYFEEDINENQIVSLYKNGFIDTSILKEFLRDEEIIEKFQNGEIGYEVLQFIDNREQIIREALEQEKLGIKEVMDLYVTEDGLDIDELKSITDNYDLTNVEIAEFLPDNVESNLVEELFMNYFISHDDLTNLVERGIITKSQAEEYAQKMASHQEYENIFNQNVGIVILTRENKGEGQAGIQRGHGTVKPLNRIKNDPELQEELLDELGFDNRVLRLTGENNSLSGYKIYPSEELGVMVFLNDKPQNATYITSLQQGLYFLNKAIREDKHAKQKNVLSSNVTKKTLRNTEHVKVKNASKGWGKNVVDAIKSLSPVLKDRLKNDDTYSKNVDTIIEEIKEDYILRKD